MKDLFRITCIMLFVLTVSALGCGGDMSISSFVGISIAAIASFYSFKLELN